MSTDTPWTVGRLLRWTTEYLQQRGSDSPRLDAEVLLAHALACERIELYTTHDVVVVDTARAEFRQLVRARAAGTPVAYLVGHREFYSLSFQVTPDVLIPRPETEQLVLEVLERAKTMTPPLRLADVGTGSGVLAICCAKYLPDSHVWATDVSQKALEVAAENSTRHDVNDRVKFGCGDLLTPVPEDAGLHFVVSNPPYVSAAEYEALPDGIRDHEPRGALLAGDTGTEVIQRLIPQAATRLAPGGWLVVEVSPMIAAQVCDLVAAEQCFDNVQSAADLAGHLRLVRAQRR